MGAVSFAPREQERAVPLSRGQRSVGMRERSTPVEQPASPAAADSISNEERLPAQALKDEPFPRDASPSSGCRTHAETVLRSHGTRAHSDPDDGLPPARVDVDPTPVNGLSLSEFLRRLNLQTSKNLWRGCNPHYNVTKQPEQSTNRDTFRWDDSAIEQVDTTHHRRRDGFTRCVILLIVPTAQNGCCIERQSFSLALCSYVEERARYCKLMEQRQNK